MTITIDRHKRPFMQRARRDERVEPTVERTLVVVPTTALRPAIANTLARVRVALPDADILVVDDDSSDGTADCAERLAQHLGHISVLRASNADDTLHSDDSASSYGRARGYQLLLTLELPDTAVSGGQTSADDGGR